MKILNSNEAYAALISGKNILCRAIGELIEFNDLDQFPATIFAKSGYEFCIKIETIEVAGITFTTPLMLDDIQDGQDVFTICTHGPAIYVSEFGKMTTSALLDSINSGFAQRDEENAKLQLQAMSKLVGRELAGDCLVVRLGSDKPKRNTGKKANSSTPPAANDASVLVEKKTFENQPESIETDAVKLVEKFTAEINAAETVDAVMQIRYQLSANGHMVRGQIIELNKLGEKRIAALTDSVDEDGDLKINGIGEQVEDCHEHQEHLEILLNDIAIAQTPAEANAQLKYTKSWTAEQRTPVIQAINKRLVELNPIAGIKIEETPSLMVQIQNAPDLTALDMLEIDVGARHPDIQPKLMGYVKKRRFDLENQTDSEVS